MPLNSTTLGKVSDRVDVMNQNCHDALVDVPAVAFESLETMKIGDERHPLRTVAQKSIVWRLGIPYNHLADQRAPSLNEGASLYFQLIQGGSPARRVMVWWGKGWG